MKFLQVSAVAVLLCVGGHAASADEIYRMTKFSFCGVPDTGSAVSVSISSSAFSDDGARVANGTGGRIVRVCETAKVAKLR
jgi:hypothetical protein